MNETTLDIIIVVCIMSLCVCMQDYILSQTTLDDVFIHFANEQNEDAGLTLLPAGRRSTAVRLTTSPSPSPASTNSLTPHIHLPDIVASIQETPPV